MLPRGLDPQLHRLAEVLDGLLLRWAVADAAGQRWNLGDPDAIFVLVQKRLPHAWIIGLTRRSPNNAQGPAAGPGLARSGTGGRGLESASGNQVRSRVRGVRRSPRPRAFSSCLFALASCLGAFLCHSTTTVLVTPLATGPGWAPEVLVLAPSGVTSIEVLGADWFCALSNTARAAFSALIIVRALVS